MASGGKREGAGRKALPTEEKKVQMVITLASASREKIKELAKLHNTTPGKLIETLIP